MEAHINVFRLLDHTQEHLAGAESPLAQSERDHLRRCGECQAVFRVIAPQLRDGSVGINGEISSTTDYYRNLCCGSEILVLAGKRFPDCNRHKDWSVVWVLIGEEGELPDLSKRRDDFAA
jgi:hypothetical protein